jgi:hypothetical protein
MNFFKFFPQRFLSNLDLSQEVHKAILSSIFKVLSIAEEDTALMVLELCITTATSTWLNEWGSWFGVIRTVDEPDDLYRARIIASIQNPKVTLSALKGNVATYLSQKYNVSLDEADITIFEPYTKIKALSKKGTISGDCRFPNGTYWRRNVIDIYLPYDADTNLRNLITQIKAAGIKVYYTQTQNSGIVVDGSDSVVDTILSDSDLEYNLYTPQQIQGNAFSRNIPKANRYLSGKHNMFCEITIIIDGDTAYDRIAQDSYIYNILVGIKQNDYKNKFGNNIPDRDKWIYDAVPIVKDDEPIDVQMPCQEFHVGYRPKMFSDIYSKLSGSSPLSGITGGGWLHNTPESTVDTFVAADDCEILSSYEIINSEYTKEYSNKSMLSGKQIIWDDCCIENDYNYPLLHNISPNSPVLTLIDVDYASVYTLDEADLIEFQPDANIEITDE